jgi:hypothetical protein
MLFHLDTNTINEIKRNRAKDYNIVVDHVFSQVMNLSDYMSDMFNFAVSAEASKCQKLGLLAIICIFLLVSSTFINASLLFAFARYKALCSRRNITVISFFTLNLIAGFLELPFVIISNFYCRFFQFLFFKSINQQSRISTK